ncbi:MAG: ATP-binding cassette domain-containing protein [Bifidobacteriaceae bacterium]|jgi:ABC-2 type transport system ATP-binding protein|nr:ATP-binding cassette domain-containing protein [Bifidobacteriaceae bacterium]
MDTTVRVDAVSRSFRVAERTVGFRATVKGLVKRSYKVIDAVRDVTFEARAGEILGVLGPNGSGKTTTLRCVSGLLTPTSGTVDALGFTPHERSRDFLRRIGFIMGQRSQLHPDVSVFDSLELRRVIYSLTDAEFHDSREELSELLGLADFGDAPVRQLSLGQRMRCEFAAALLHRPALVLLDEPTIGLDFDAQAAIRGFVERYVAAHRACVLLTSHHLADIEALAGRVVVMAKGRLVFEGSLGDLRRLHSDRQLVTLAHDGGLDAGGDLGAGLGSGAGLGAGAGLGGALGLALGGAGAGIELAGSKPGEITLTVPRAAAPAALAALGALPGVTGLSLTDPPLEDALARFYSGDAAGPDDD